MTSPTLMDRPARKIMALPAVTMAGLAVKAKAAAFACSHFYRSFGRHLGAGSAVLMVSGLSADAETARGIRRAVPTAARP
jgi:hypothetical protein